MPTNKARTSDNAQKQSAIMPFPYSILIYCFVLCQTSHHPHGADHVPTTYLPPFQHISTSYCFRIVSVLFPLPEARTIGERYGINTGLIRERYENNTRTVFSDSHPKLLIRNLIFLSLFLLIIFYISTTCLFQLFMPRRRAHHLPWRSLYTKITFRSAECKPISMN